MEEPYYYNKGMTCCFGCDKKCQFTEDDKIDKKEHEILYRHIFCNRGGRVDFKIERKQAEQGG